MLYQCWSSDPTRRPQAAGIVEFLASDPELITPCLDTPPASIVLEDTYKALDCKGFDRARVHSFSSVWQSRKSAAPLDPSNPGYFDTNQIIQAGLETVQSAKQTGLKHHHKKSLHESFKKAKRNFRKKSAQDDLPQITYL